MDLMCFGLILWFFLLFFFGNSYSSLFRYLSQFGSQYFVFRTFIYIKCLIESFLRKLKIEDSHLMSSTRSHIKQHPSLHSVNISSRAKNNCDILTLGYSYHIRRIALYDKENCCDSFEIKISAFYINPHTKNIGPPHRSPRRHGVFESDNSMNSILYITTSGFNALSCDL